MLGVLQCVLSINQCIYHSWIVVESGELLRGLFELFWRVVEKLSNCIQCSHVSNKFYIHVASSARTCG